MRGAVVAIVFAFSLSALAGCLAGDEGGGPSTRGVTLPFEREDPTNNSTVLPPVADLGQVPVPTWSVGDYWTIVSGALHGDATVWTNYTAVVVRADGSYVLGAGDNQTTYVDGLLVDLLPIGAVDASLEPTWRGGAFPMFQWPLANGQSWTADVTLDGDPAPLAFNAGFDTAIETPYGLRPGFLVSVTDNGTLLFAYTYVPAAGWFTLFEEYDEGGTRVRWITLSGWGSGWSEPAYTIETRPLLERALAYERPETPDATFDVAGEPSYLFVWVHGKQRGIAVSQHAVLFGPDNDHRATYGRPTYHPAGSPACGQGQLDRTVGCTRFPNEWWSWGTLQPKGGTWRLELVNVGAANLEARVIAVTDVVHNIR